MKRIFTTVAPSPRASPAPWRGHYGAAWPRPRPRPRPAGAARTSPAAVGGGPPPRAAPPPRPAAALLGTASGSGAVAPRPAPPPRPPPCDRTPAPVACRRFAPHQRRFAPHRSEHQRGGRCAHAGGACRPPRPRREGSGFGGRASSGGIATTVRECVSRAGLTTLRRTCPGRQPPFLAVKRPARPHRSPVRISIYCGER